MLEQVLRFLGVYSLYGKWLKRQVENEDVPRHVGVILDGNRRWASEKGVEPWMGHRAGAEKVEKLIRWCGDLGIKILTLYVFSIENLERSQREVHEVMRLLKEKALKAQEDEEIMKKGVRIKLIGKKEYIPNPLLDDIVELENMTEDNENMIVNIAIAYGGKTEIVDATKNIVRDVLQKKMDVDQIDEDRFQGYLYTSHLQNPDVDVIIRTSGEMRLSGFLLYQSAYSELVFLDVYWPDFRKIDLMRAIRTYQRRIRKFGK